MIKDKLDRDITYLFLLCMLLADDIYSSVVV